MINVFKTLRKQLLKTGKFTGYLSYAAGEIILVVLGILIALQINNWNEERKQRNLVKSYYESFYTDLEKDSMEFSRKRNNAERNIRKLKNILRFIESGYRITNTQIDTIYWPPKKYSDTLALVLCISQAGFVQFPNIYENTISDLRSTGNIKLLKNKALKSKLTDYYNIQKLIGFWTESLIPAREHMETALNTVLNNEERVAYNTTEGLTREKTDYLKLVAKLKANRHFEEYIIGMLHLHYRIIKQCNDHQKDYVEPLMAALKKEF